MLSAFPNAEQTNHCLSVACVASVYGSIGRKTPLHKFNLCKEKDITNIYSATPMCQALFQMPGVRPGGKWTKPACSDEVYIVVGELGHQQRGEKGHGLSRCGEPRGSGSERRASRPGCHRAPSAQRGKGISKRSSREPGLVPGSALKGLLVYLQKETRLAPGAQVILSWTGFHL